MMRQVGSAQKRALIALAEASNGVGDVPFRSAPGLINKGLVNFVARTDRQDNSPYICQITEAGREFVAGSTWRAPYAPGEAQGLPLAAATNSFK
ncbi:hypothetical protein LJR225_000725 [Phenylobacterium sp. LjRoot225]|uniref:hypothetical protein n=1 Tax=Phenylobacterium sp. LjRoot225 TaxID=3342285 RepID=UPI003ED02E50